MTSDITSVSTLVVELFAHFLEDQSSVLDGRTGTPRIAVADANTCRAQISVL